MPRPQNTERKQEIEQQARSLFRIKGYRATSYSDIAAACGLEKTHVQIHFAKKDLFITHLLSDLLDAADEYFEQSGAMSDDYMVNLYLVGQIYHAFLLQDEGMRLLTLDILSERKLTELMIQADLDWADRYISEFPHGDEQKILRDITLVMGGVYELVYRSLAAGESVSPKEIQFRTISTFMLLQGIPLEKASALLSDDAVPDIDFTEAVAYLNNKLF